MAGSVRGLVVLVSCLVAGCYSPLQAMTPEAEQVRYLEGAHSPSCRVLGEVTVGREWFVFDERQPAKNSDDVIVRMRRLGAKAGGNLVVIVENEPPNAKCSGHNGLAQIYQCSPTQLASMETLPGG